MANNKAPQPEKSTSSADDQHNWSDREITGEKEDRFSSKDYAGVRPITIQPDARYASDS